MIKLEKFSYQIFLLAIANMDTGHNFVNILYIKSFLPMPIHQCLSSSNICTIQQHLNDFMPSNYFIIELVLSSSSSSILCLEIFLLWSCL